MKNNLLHLLQIGFPILFATFLPHRIQGQCTTQVLHTSGTQQVGCTSITVTSDGAAGVLNFCVETPYWIGIGTASGSYTFTFSPPVLAVSLGLTAINNQPAIPSQEEVRFEINGAPYPITVPGTPGICFTPAVITPTGAVSAVSGQVGDWENMDINTSISTLKVEDVIFAGTPNGVIFSLFICSCCETDAGTMPTQTLHACINDPATLTHNGDEVLDNDDLLQFILFSNPADTLGSSIAVSNTPTFTFNPATMQTGVTYYVAAFAGNNVGGNVDLNDPCLDISNAAELIWHPLPEVELQTDTTDVCPGDCRTLTAVLSGTPPFTLTVSSPAGTASFTFQNNTDTFEICPPPGAPPGSFLVQATALTDAYCTCP